MARKFIIKVAAGKKEDIFYMKEAKEFLYFYSSSLKCLRATLKSIMAKGYRIPSTQTLSKRLNYDGRLVGKSPFFQTFMFEIKEVESKIKIKKTLLYTNNWGFEHNLKIIDESNEALFTN